MMKLKDFNRRKYKVGDRHCHLTILGPLFRLNRRGYACVCVCDCGTVCVKRERDFHTEGRGRVCSNRCLLKDRDVATDSTRKLRKLWESINFRCHNENCQYFHNYGGRGIYVCHEWRADREAFIDWCRKNGWAPDKQIDRTDNDGPYSPDNCRFVTPKENCNNRRSSRLLTMWGETKTVAEWGRDRRVEASSDLIRARLSYGWSAERSLTTPVRKGNYRRKAVSK